MYFQHEDLSLKMFDYLVDDNKLSPEFEKFDLTETDKTFIKELIKGRENDQNGVKKMVYLTKLQKDCKKPIYSSFKVRLISQKSK